MREVKSSLIEIAAQILIGCPVSTDVEDWQLPKYVSGKQQYRIQQKLDKLDSWLKKMCIKVRDAADTLEDAPSASTNTGSPKCTHYQSLADCVWQGEGSNNGITCSDSGPCVWTLRAMP